MAKKKKDNYPDNAYDYTDWLYNSNRLTAEEHIKMKKFLLQLEDEVATESIGC
ncbi:MAG: hypothetical protein ACREBR_04675 [bacterium]